MSDFFECSQKLHICLTQLLMQANLSPILRLVRQTSSKWLALWGLILLAEVTQAELALAFLVSRKTSNILFLRIAFSQLILSWCDLFLQSRLLILLCWYLPSYLSRLEQSFSSFYLTASFYLYMVPKFCRCFVRLASICHSRLTLISSASRHLAILISIKLLQSAPRIISTSGDRLSDQNIQFNGIRRRCGW